MGLRGPEPLDVGLKSLRGTVKVSRERARGALRVVEETAPAEGEVEPGSVADYVGVADGYVDDVLTGRIVSCRWVQKAAQRYRRMRGRAEEDGSPFVFSEWHANDVCAFAEECPHVEGRWGSETVTLQPFQVFILVACYGFRSAGSMLRLVTVVYFQVARKSAKSTLVAIAGLYHLAREREPGAQVVCGATTGLQARIVFGIMQKMVRRSGFLRDEGLWAYANAVTLEAIGGNARPINSKSSTQDGLNPSFISLDESHAQTFELMDVLMSAMGARPEGMFWCPTTAGYNLTSVGYAFRQTAQKILDGVVESDHTFAILYELEEADDWRDERVWVKAAPMIGITPKLEYVRRYCQDAQQTPGMQGEFETKICNRWLHSASRWLRIEDWDKCADPTLTLEQFEFEKCWIGVDLAERDDIAVVSLNFRKGDLIVSFVKGYLPALVIADRERAVPLYREFVKTDDLVATDGDFTDHRRIEEDIRGWCKRFEVQAIVIERYGALHMTANLAEAGLPARVESKNARVFTPPAKDFEARIRSKRFRHTGCVFLRWQASNVCVDRRRDGSLLPTKDAPESPLKIDGIDAILLGLSALVEDPTETREPAIYFLGGI